MNRTFVIPVAAALVLAVQAGAQRNFDDVQIKTHPVRDHVYMLEGSGGNIGVSVGEDGILIIDDQFAPLVPKIRSALEDLSPNKLEFVLNTHHHGDHTGGNAEFGKEAHIVSHENVRTRLAHPSADPNALPVITFEDSLTIHFNGDTIRMIHAPAGHTDNDSIIYFERANVVHMGDHFFAGRFPFIDTASGGSVKGYLENLENALNRIPEDAKIIPGHGPLSNIDDLKKFRDAIKECADIVQKQIDEGRSLDEVREKGLPEKFDDWGSGFVSTDRWLGTLYGDLKG